MSMTTSETPGDLKYLDASARRHIELNEAQQRQRVMVVGDIHGLLRARVRGAGQMRVPGSICAARAHAHVPRMLIA
jgi:hypothetical protein